MDATRNPRDAFAIADEVLRDCVAVALREAGLAEQSDAIATISLVAGPESALHALGALTNVARKLPRGGPESQLGLIRRGVVLSVVCVGYALDGVVQGAAEVARVIRERMAAAGVAGFGPS